MQSLLVVTFNLKTRPKWIIKWWLTGRGYLNTFFFLSPFGSCFFVVAFWFFCFFVLKKMLLVPHLGNENWNAICLVSWAIWTWIIAMVYWTQSKNFNVFLLQRLACVQVHNCTVTMPREQIVLLRGSHGLPTERGLSAVCVQLSPKWCKCSLQIVFVPDDSSCKVGG